MLTHDQDGSPRTRTHDQDGSARDLTYDPDGFRRGGRPHRIVSGALHYFRVHPDLWEDRLTRLRALGVNTVDTYVPWNFHETAPGKADFTGPRDLARFLTLAAGLGLDAIVRPGPYICAEWDFGGLPARLLALDGLHLRCSDPRFQAEVDGWFDCVVPELLPLLAGRGGPVVAVQIENEYGSYGNDARYRAHVEQALTARGVDCLLFTADGPEDAMLQGGMLPGRLATATFGAEPAQRLAHLRRYQPTGPLAAMEFWIGWFDHWGEQHHVRSADEAARSLGELLATGASVNLYMAHGGTNFGFWAGANHTGSRPGDPGYQPTTTSYDYDAPIGEAGELTPKFHAFREVIGKYLPLPDGPLPGLPPRITPALATPAGAAPLLAHLPLLGGAPVARPAPEPMEKLGQDHGLIHYRTTVTGPRPAMPVRIDGLGDRAYLFADGHLLGVLDRNAPDDGIDLPVDEGGVVLDVLVRAQGRVNYGPLLDDRKGIWRGVRHGHQHLFEWEVRPLPLTDLTGLRWSPEHPEQGHPAFHRFTHTLPTAPADGFVDVGGWGTGLLWLNGFLLGHYDTPRGPQRTLYAPAPLWRTGENELVVLELERPGAELPLRDQPDLGRPTVVTLQ
ncbi:glycoside hydrolase family 35 protein [Streptomyces sp. NBC_00539]|uniref:glycoside hydrolase family 35 protein n=1 Tax=Streptomyces sp. NBC_00539 TaxID=2975770 RepID=UPI002E7FDE47|nr:beta-galactosidase family protein [Streptomyces sp. NBC_00539]WUC63431.1 beta-galactosidase [Streptomyces sp. NBC_00539]